MIKKRKANNVDIFLAQFISWIYNPFFIIPITLMVSHLQEINKNPFPFIFFLSVGGLPSILYYLYEEFKHKAKPWEFLVSIPREKRNTPLLIAVYSFLFVTIILSGLGEILWVEISVVMVIFAGSMYLANKYIDKASWHAAAMAFCVFYFVDKISLNYTFGLLLLPVIFWSRVLLHKHSWLQLYLGMVIGLVVGLLSWTVR